MQTTATLEHYIGYVELQCLHQRPTVSGVYVDEWSYEGRRQFTPRSTAGLGGRDFSTMRAAIAYARRVLPAMTMETVQ